MICPHGNEAPEAPWLMCAQCEADAEFRPLVLAEVKRLADRAAGVIDLADDEHQLELPAELIPRPAGTLL